MAEKKRFLASLHNHSTASDGLNSPDRLITAAVNRDLDVIGISDHDTTKGIPSFLDTAESSNNNTPKEILAIGGIEITTKQGDILFSFPNRDKLENFLIQYYYDGNHPHALDVIERYVRDYQAFAIFLHPELKVINGITLAEIEQILSKVDEEFCKHLGIEMYNYMSYIIPWRGVAENKVAAANREWGLTEWGGADAHFARHVARGQTAIKMSDLSAVGFTQAVLRADTEVIRPEPRLLAPIERAVAIGIVEATSERGLARRVIQRSFQAMNPVRSKS